jgi:hypothetical protein
MGVAQMVGMSSDTFGRARPFRVLMWHRASGRVSDASRRAPTGLIIVFSFSRRTLPLLFTIFSRGFSRFLNPFCPFVHFLSIPGTLLVLYILFNVLLSVRILDLLWNMFEMEFA